MEDLAPTLALRCLSLGSADCSAALGGTGSAGALSEAGRPLCARCPVSMLTWVTTTVSVSAHIVSANSTVSLNVFSATFMQALLFKEIPSFRVG